MKISSNYLSLVIQNDFLLVTIRTPGIRNSLAWRVLFRKIDDLNSDLDSISLLSWTQAHEPC